MITDEEISQLPEEPELAFVEFEKILRDRLNEYERQAEREQFSTTDYKLEYINKVLAAAKEYGIDELSNWQVPSVNDDIYRAFNQFSSDVDHFTVQIRIRYAPRYRKGSVGLYPESLKTRI